MSIKHAALDPQVGSSSHTAGKDSSITTTALSNEEGMLEIQYHRFRIPNQRTGPGTELSGCVYYTKRADQISYDSQWKYTVLWSHPA